MVHGKIKCVRSVNKLDSTSNRDCFSVFWVHGYLNKSKHLWYMVKKLCMVWKQVGQYDKKRMFLCILGAWLFKNAGIYGT